MKVTALVLTNGRNEYIKENVNSLMNFSSDIFVVVNGFNRDTVSFLENTQKAYPKLNFFVIEQEVPKCTARNIGVGKTDTDIIYFLDDDTYTDTDTVKIIKDKFELYPYIGVIGGPNLNPEDSSDFEKITGFILSTYFMSWKMSRRYFKAGTDRLTDDSELILCNMAIKKELFVKHNLEFNEKLHYNEENLLMEQLKLAGVKILYTPELYVYHHRRPDTSSYSEQIFNSGKGRGIMTVIMPSSFKVIHTVPALFILYIFAAAAGIMTHNLFLVYLVLILFNSVYTALTYSVSFTKLFLMIFISVISHMAYGIGYIYGIIQGLIWKQKKFI